MLILCCFQLLPGCFFVKRWHHSQASFSIKRNWSSVQGWLPRHPPKSLSGCVGLYLILNSVKFVIGGWSLLAYEATHKCSCVKNHVGRKQWGNRREGGRDRGREERKEKDLMMSPGIKHVLECWKLFKQSAGFAGQHLKALTNSTRGLTLNSLSS